MDVRTAVSLALKYNAALAMLREDLNVAKAERGAAFQMNDPELRVTYGSSDSMTERFETADATNAPWVVKDLEGQIIGPWPQGTATSVTTTRDNQDRFQVALRLFPPNFFAIARRIKAADARIAAAEARVREAEWELVADVRLAYEDLTFLRKDLDALRRLMQLQADLEKTLRSGAEAGAVTVLDIADASRRYLQTVADRDRVARDRLIAMRATAVLIGVEASAIVLPDSAPPLKDIQPDKLDAKSLEETALRHRAETIACLWECRAADADLREAKANSYPWMSYLQATYRMNTQEAERDPFVPWTGTDGSSMTVQSPDTLRDEGSGSDWSVEAGIVLPFFSVMTSPTAPQKALCLRRRVELQAAVDNIVGDVHDRLAELKASKRDTEEHSRNTLPHVRQVEKVLAENEKQGGVAPRDVSRLREGLLASERTGLRFEYEYRKAVIQLEKAVGTDPRRAGAGDEDADTDAGGNDPQR